jgi:hypothetical protein
MSHEPPFWLLLRNYTSTRLTSLVAVPSVLMHEVLVTDLAQHEGLGQDAGPLWLKRRKRSGLQDVMLVYSCSQIRFLADPSLALTKSLDLSFDAASIFGGDRSKRATPLSSRMAL